MGCMNHFCARVELAFSEMGRARALSSAFEQACEENAPDSHADRSHDGREANSVEPRQGNCKCGKGLASTLPPSAFHASPCSLLLPSHSIGISSKRTAYAIALGPGQHVPRWTPKPSPLE